MRQYSNGYIIGFATAVCLVCSVVVSTSAVALRERQDRNKVLDRQTKVLVVAGLLEEGEKATPEEIEALFEANVVSKIVDLDTGEYDLEADAATYDQRLHDYDPAVGRRRLEPSSYRCFTTNRTVMPALRRELTKPGLLFMNAFYNK